MGVGTSREAFCVALAALVGCPCWDASAGRGTGSFVLMSLGKKIPREQELPNPRLELEKRSFRGEYVLYIMSSWRLDSAKQVVCGAWDDNSPGGPMLKGLSRLSGATVSEFSLDEVALDLSLHFSNGLCLKIFCDRLSVDQWENYWYSTPVGTYTVGLQSELSFEAPSPSEESQPGPPGTSLLEAAR